MESSVIWGTPIVGVCKDCYLIKNNYQRQIVRFIYNSLIVVIKAN